MRGDAALRQARERSRRLRAVIDGIEALFPVPGLHWGERVYDPLPGDPLQAFKLDLIAQAVEAVAQATMLLLGRPVAPVERFDPHAFDTDAHARIAQVLAGDPERAAYMRLCDAMRDAAATLRPMLAPGAHASAVVSGFPDPATRGLPMEPGCPTA